MGLYEFFFPHQAQSDMLWELARLQKLTARRLGAQRVELSARVAELEQDLGYVTLVLGSILRKLDAKGVVTRDDLKREIAQLDELDGLKDGKLDIQLLRDMHGT